jgi:hypothetical protein
MVAMYLMQTQRGKPMCEQQSLDKKNQNSSATCGGVLVILEKREEEVYPSSYQLKRYETSDT